MIEKIKRMATVLVSFFIIIIFANVPKGSFCFAFRLNHADGADPGQLEVNEGDGDGDGKVRKIIFIS